MTSSFNKFLLLSWKNWKIQSRHKKQTVFELLFPIFLVGILVLLRGESRPNHRDKLIYNDTNLDCKLNGYINYTIKFSNYVAYSPAGNNQIRKIAEKVLTELNKNIKRNSFYEVPQLKLVEKNDSNDLREFLLQENPLVGLQFDDDLHNSNELPKKLDYTLRFREFSSDPVWKTDTLINVNQFSREPRKAGDATGGSPYISNCFLLVQRAIDQEFLAITSNSPQKAQNIRVKRFPDPPYVSDQVFEAASAFLPMFFVISFMYTVRNIIKDVSLEKEQQLKEALKMVGIKNWLHWTGWFVKNLIFLLISLTVISLFLTSPLIPRNHLPVLPYSSPLLIWLILFIYSISFITFCFLMTIPFKKATTNATVGYILWMMIGVPYLPLLQTFHTFKYITKLALCMLTNTGMGFTINTILKLEANGIGLQWYNIFTRKNVNKFSVGDCLLGLILGAIIMMLLTLYLEQVFPGKYGIPRKWYFPFEKLMNWKSKYNPMRESFGDESKKTGDTFEDEPIDKVGGIKIRSLSKTFKGKKKAVTSLYLNIYEDQITVLLGHNGAGKTTTMSMLTGMYPPTSGTAIIDGKDIRFQIDQVRDSLGLCPQHNVLFDELTVEEHIQFFSRLRGLSSKEVKQEVRKYVSLLELEPKRKCLAKTLSGGMKRKLSIAIALCGKSKIVMLDEPTAGMDPSARRKLWDLLINEKVGRTILLTTHFMDEADVLGDRIAVMAEGDLKACGSSFFLKKRFGVGYRLVCVKDQTCEPEKLTQLLRNFIPDVKVETDIGTELTYVLNESFITIFQKMFEELEEKSEEMGITSYGVSLTTMEEVFLKIGTDAHVLQRMSSVDSQSPELNRDDTDNVRRFREDTSFFYLSGVSLQISQCIAMFKKKFHYTRRNYKSMMFNLIFSVLILAWKLGTTPGKTEIYPSMEISLSKYESTYTLIQNDGNSQLASHYKAIAESYNSKVIEVPQGADMDEFLLKKYNESYQDVVMDYIVGVSFRNNSPILAWFNNEALHSLPLTISLINRAVLKSSLGDSYDIGVTNSPFYFEEKNDKTFEIVGDILGDIMLGFFLFIIYSNWTSVFISFYIKERVSRAKLLQTISGVNKVVFWMSSYIFDAILMILISLIIIATISIFQVQHYKTAEELFRLFLIFTLYSLSSLPMTYLFSHLFTQASTGESMNTLLGITSGLVLYGVYLVFSLVLESKGFWIEIVNVLYWIFLLSPHFILCDVLKKIIWLNFQHQPFSGLIDEVDKMDLEMLRKGIGDYWSFKEGVTGNLLAFLVVGVIYVILLLCKEYHFFHRIFYLAKLNQGLPDLNEEMDSDVREEMDRVTAMSPEQIAEQNLLMQNLTKYYGNLLAVRRVCVAVGDSSCFGLLGANGAGKTSVFKMLTGDEFISNGDAFVQKLSIKTQINEVHKRIGYCPQFDALLEDLTGRETMEIFCLLRGIPRSQVKTILNKLAKKLDFDPHLDKQIKACSGGNKRKLSTALALIGDPQVIFLDEPTTGMDPGAKRKLWDVIIKMRSHGKSVILTSHSMEECEALCTRLAIMVNGEFKCLGSTQHLKNKFSKGFILSIKAGKSERMERAEHILEIKDFVNQTFPGAILKEEYLDILTYQIESTELKWSKMFGLMQQAKEQLEIDDYSLGQTSLEQVFLFLTKSTLMSDT